MPNLPPAAFFDRDGVLNRDQGYTHKIEEFEWLPGAIEALRLCQAAGYLVFIVTNQSGIGRGYYSSEQFERLCHWMLQELSLQKVKISALYHCPHHPDALPPYNITCRCRKPGPGMLEQAAREFAFRKAGSFLIGDKQSDCQAAAAFGIQGFLYGADLGPLDQYVWKILQQI